MKFDLTNKTAEELLERQQVLSAEIPAEEREAGWRALRAKLSGRLAENSPLDCFPPAH